MTLIFPKLNSVIKKKIHKNICNSFSASVNKKVKNKSSFVPQHLTTNTKYLDNISIQQTCYFSFGSFSNVIIT